ncbi:large ribosomal subunit protein bL28m-like [Ornithodoros turicata]|uniref:large ribosomal subunit protein bL28m-like n=1 Tax=Ornithodoros turicata TaxID=34597 RepID=UPI00313917AA
MSAKKFIPVVERFPKHYQRFLKELEKPSAAVHYKEYPEKYIKDPETKEIKRVQNVPIPVLYPEECQKGIWGGEGIIKGYMPLPKFNKRYAKYFTPSLKRIVVYSEILDKYMMVTATERTILLINKHFGFDNYILQTPVQDLKSQLALDLRRKMLLALARKDLYLGDPKKREEVIEKYKEHIVPEEEAEWFGLTFEQAEKKLIDCEDAVEPQPLKYQFLKDYLEELKVQKESKLQPQKQTSWVSRMNPFRRTSPPEGTEQVPS